MYKDYLKNLIHGEWTTGVIPTSIVLLLTERDMSTVEIADYFDTDVKRITYHIGNLKASGYVKRVGSSTTHGVAVSSRTGNIMTTSKTAAVYTITDKFKKMAGIKCGL
jgi:predicted transcriptional regulator